MHLVAYHEYFSDQKKLIELLVGVVRAVFGFAKTHKKEMQFFLEKKVNGTNALERQSNIQSNDFLRVSDHHQGMVVTAF